MLTTRKSVVKDGGDKAQRFFNSIAEGIYIFQSDKERALKVMGKYTKVNDRTILENTYADNKDVHSPNLRPTASGVKTILDILVVSNPKAASAKPVLTLARRPYRMNTEQEKALWTTGNEPQ